MLTFDSTKESNYESNLDIAFFRFSSNRKTFNRSLVMYNEKYDEYPDPILLYSWDYYDCIKHYNQFYVLPYENANVNI